MKTRIISVICWSAFKEAEFLLPGRCRPGSKVKGLTAACPSSPALLWLPFPARTPSVEEDIPWQRRAGRCEHPEETTLTSCQIKPSRWLRGVITAAAEWPAGCPLPPTSSHWSALQPVWSLSPCRAAGLLAAPLTGWASCSCSPPRSSAAVSLLTSDLLLLDSLTLFWLSSVFQGDQRVPINVSKLDWAVGFY